MPITDRFLSGVRSRLSRALTARSLVAALVAGAAGALIWALAWRCFGYAAPRAAYLWIAAVPLLAALAMAILRRPDTHRAAAFADRHFSLKDALVSYLDFAARPDGARPIYQLQRDATAAAITGKDPATIPLGVRRRALWLGAILTVVAAVLAILPHSPAVAAKLRAEQETLDRSNTVATELQQIVEELIAGMDEHEREVLKPETLRAWAKELAPTKDQRDMMKAVARFEQKIATAAAGLEARKDAEVLKLAAAELDASQLADAKQLARKLDAKDFQAAQQKLGEMKPKQGNHANPDDLAKMRQSSAKMKEIARRMANGARKRDFGKTPANERLPGEAKELDELLKDLDQAADAADKELQADLDPGEMEKMEKAGELDKDLQQLRARLGKLDAGEKAKNRLKALGKCAAKANSFAAGRSQTLGLAQQMMAGIGGLKPGTGHTDGKRNERDEARDNNNMTKLEGNLGQGESQSSVESAESGTGVSGRGQSARERDFRKQTESLVHRDDVPEELKQGIREYFERIHNIPEDK
ncbi:MAG: hypothetical protein J0M04_02370 [Verrucomicrobia bacterium]|nr:hypothetical protein [Verrucomicrobiota bacterium]